MKIVFDIESNGFLKELDTIHCIALQRLGIDTEPELFVGGTKIQHALTYMSHADELIGHNIQAFDIPAIKKVYPNWGFNGKVRDTLIISRLQHPHDMRKHALAVWGEKLKIPKGDFGKQTDWKEYSEAMGLYCQQDVRVNVAVWNQLNSEGFSEQSWNLEHRFAQCIDDMMANGVKMNTTAMMKLGRELVADEARMKAELTEGIGPFVDKTTFVPKVNNKTRGYLKGVPTIKVKETPFNPGSRPQCVRLLREKYNWKPKIYTDKGNPVISGDVLRSLDYPEAKLLAPYYDTRKLMGMVVTGDAAWIKKVKNGRIHGYVNHNGAVTGRCTHSGPNLAQVPAPRGFRGQECRSLFTTGKGRRIVGCDASGLELRNLAHYMAAYDGGKYAKVILEGDVHTTNQEAADLDTRDGAKTFIYAHNYGAGDEKLGKIKAPGASKLIQKMEGARMRAKFLVKIPALKTLISQVKSAAKKRGYLKGLDGRKLYVHSDHVALNVLLQGAGAVFMKKATVIACDTIKREGLDAKMILHIHDEFQFEVADCDVERVKEILEDSMTDAGEFFKYRILMEGESKSGETWYDTH